MRGAFLSLRTRKHSNRSEGPNPERNREEDFSGSCPRPSLTPRRRGADEPGNPYVSFVVFSRRKAISGIERRGTVTKTSLFFKTTRCNIPGSFQRPSL